MSAPTLTMIEAKNGLIGADKARVSFDGQTVEIKRGTFGHTEAKIPVSRITMVGWHKGLLSGGHIQFVAAEVDGRVRFTRRHMKEFEALRAAVDQAVAR